MKRILLWLGGIFLGLLVVVAAVMGYLAYLGSPLDASSKAYVDESVKAITSAWSKEELLKRASPQLQQVIKEEELGRLFAKLSQLGKLQEYEGSKGDANISLTIQAGKVITASYIASARFDKGPAQVTVRLIQNDGRWQILQFYVNSPIFLQ